MLKIYVKIIWKNRRGNNYTKKFGIKCQMSIECITKSMGKDIESKKSKSRKIQIICDQKINLEWFSNIQKTCQYMLGIQKDKLAPIMKQHSENEKSLKNKA
jgi:hypothetical protein